MRRKSGDPALRRITGNVLEVAGDVAGFLARAGQRARVHMLVEKRGVLRHRGQDLREQDRLRGPGPPQPEEAAVDGHEEERAAEQHLCDRTRVLRPKAEEICNRLAIRSASLEFSPPAWKTAGLKKTISPFDMGSCTLCSTK